MSFSDAYATTENRTACDNPAPPRMAACGQKPAQPQESPHPPTHGNDAKTRQQKGCDQDEYVGPASSPSSQ